MKDKLEGGADRLPWPDPGCRGIVFYDGDCGLCQSSVQWLLRVDRSRRLRFAPLAGLTAAAFLEPRWRQLDSLVYLKRDQPQDPLDRSGAVGAILQDVGRGWQVLGALRWVPKPWRDGVYGFIARRRHRWGRPASCRLPSADERSRFLP